MRHGLFGTKERIQIGPAWSADGSEQEMEFDSLDEALEFLRPCIAREDDMSRLRALLARDRTAMDVRQLDDEAVLNEIAWRLTHGRFHLLREPVKRRPLPPKSQPGPAPVASTAPPPRKQMTWVEFLFQYPDHSPVSGLDYIFEDTAGVQEAGTLGANGLISRKDVPEGTYGVILKDVVKAGWEPAKAGCDDPVKITATTTGFPYGTAAKIRIFREFREMDKDVVETLQGKVQNDRLEVEWKYDYASTDQRKAETGTARFIAEVQFEGGKYWAKTPQALEMQLKSIDQVTWAQPRIEEGKSVDVEIETRGFPDGTAVQVELWRHHWAGDPEKIASPSPKPLSGGKAKLRIGYGKGAAGEAVIKDGGEYFLTAKIDGKAPRTAHSPLVWCVHAGVKEPAAAAA